MTESVLYGGQSSARVRIHHLQQAKERGEKWAMLTAYDTNSAAVFEEAGIPVLCEATVDTLYTGDGAIRGIGLTRPDGSRERIACPVIVVNVTSDHCARAGAVRNIPNAPNRAGPSGCFAISTR